MDPTLMDRRRGTAHHPLRSVLTAWMLVAAGATLLCLATAGAGCARPEPPEGQTAAGFEDADLDALWDATISVLRKFDFELDRRDRAQGIITTHPLTSMQWHEPWRQDIATGYDLAQSSLHTIQRQVTVRFIRGQSWNIDVQVDVYRLSTPETQVTSASSAIQAFSGILPTTEGTYAGGDQAVRNWVLMYRDGAMEDRILRRILRE